MADDNPQDDPAENTDTETVNLAELGFQIPRCVYCGNSSRSFRGFEGRMHFGMPIFHSQKQGQPHVGMISLVCDRCGHVEFFTESIFGQMVSGEEPDASS